VKICLNRPAGINFDGIVNYLQDKTSTRLALPANASFCHRSSAKLATYSLLFFFLILSPGFSQTSIL